MFKKIFVFPPKFKRGNYTLAFLDLHWESSEHEVNGEKLQMEAQLHHYNPWFDSYEDAVEHPGQTLVLAILFQVRPLMSHQGLFLFQNLI